MKNPFKGLRSRIDKYFLTLEKRGRRDPLFALYLISEGVRIGVIVIVLVYLLGVLVTILK